jgi:hypothetical protein
LRWSILTAKETQRGLEHFNFIRDVTAEDDGVVLEGVVAKAADPVQVLFVVGVNVAQHEDARLLGSGGGGRHRLLPRRLHNADSAALVT